MPIASGEPVASNGFQLMTPLLPSDHLSRHPPDGGRLAPAARVAEVTASSACERRSPIALRRRPAAGGSMIRTRGWMWHRSGSWQQSRLPNALACQPMRTLQLQ